MRVSLKHLLCAFFWAVYFTTSVLALDVINPTKPNIRDIPDRNHLGEKVRGINLSTTSVLRMPNGERFLFYGYIVGRPNGSSNYFLWNDKLNMECFGKTVRQANKSGSGNFSCTQNGAKFMDGDFLVAPNKYMKLKATTTASFLDESGGTIWWILRWQGKRQFPDPTPLLNAFK
jgi:hypothetical protein